VVTNLVFLNYSRDQEAEADRVGVRTMYEAGWDPRGMVALFETLNEAKGARPPEFMSSHPAPGDRIQSIRAQINDWPRLDAKRQDAQAFHRFKRELRDQT
jgi:predicted Zn-dependent protease